MLLARVKVEGSLGAHCVGLGQFGENLPVVAACNKGPINCSTPVFCFDGFGLCLPGKGSLAGPVLRGR